MTVSELAASLESADAPLLVTHRHADRDSLGAAIGLRALLGRGTVCTPDGVAGPARSLLEATDTAPVTDPDPTAYDAVVVLDAPSAERIAPIDPDTPLVIDHHERGDLADRAAATFVDADAGATAVLVADLAEHAGWEVTPDAALPLLVGVLDDTGFLAAASPDTVATAVRIVGELGERAPDLPALIDRSLAPGERMARALGTLRATGYRSGDDVVAVSRVGGHETAAAVALRDAGVDLAAVCSRRGDGVRVTARASDRFAERVSLGAAILPSLASEFGGDGGGHAGAGVAHLASGTTEAIEEFLLADLERELETTFGRISR